MLGKTYIEVIDSFFLDITKDNKVSLSNFFSRLLGIMMIILFLVEKRTLLQKKVRSKRNL